MASIVQFTAELSTHQFAADGQSKTLATLALCGTFIITLPFLTVRLKSMVWMIAVGIYAVFQAIFFGDASLNNLIRDAGQYLVFFLCLILGHNYHRHSNDSLQLFYFFLGCCFVAIAGIKLQTSYAGAVLLIYFFVSSNFKSLVSSKGEFLLLTVSLGGFLFSLLGKSVLIAIFSVIIFFFASLGRFGRPFFILLSFGAAVYLFDLSFIGSVTNINTFVKYSFESGFASDASSLQRLYEAFQVWDKINTSPNSLLFGMGFGGTVDLSLSPDPLIATLHQDPTSVRMVHFGPFYLMLKFGLVFLFLFYFLFAPRFFAKIFKYFPFMNTEAKIASIYLVLIFIDGQFSAGHMFSNPLFWFCTGFITRYKAGGGDYVSGSVNRTKPS